MYYERMTKNIIQKQHERSNLQNQHEYNIVAPKSNKIGTEILHLMLIGQK